MTSRNSRRGYESGWRKSKKYKIVKAIWLKAYAINVAKSSKPASVTWPAGVAGENSWLIVSKYGQLA